VDERADETILTQWGPSIAVFTAPNAGPKTLEGTRTYVVGGYIIDPGPDVPEYQSLIASVFAHPNDPARFRRRRWRSAEGILLTHGHPDHASGAARLASLLDAPVYASPNLDRRFIPNDLWVRPIEDGYSFNALFESLTTIAAPGHSDDHIAFWLEQDRVLFAGDTVLGRGTSLVAPPEGNMRLYMQTLERFQALNPRIICPGHGPIVDDPAAKLAEYVEHRRQRERQVVEALGHGPATARELVERIYLDVDRRLHDLAEGSVMAQLQKLKEEGKVRATREQYRLA
jgi:glyoxylase-like metal-dependent hydrolase (beta-lactamase superfamily II)